MLPPQAMNQETSATGQTPLRIIKKYPNRRLYDTTTSSYITLAQVKDLVMQREAFEVRDAKTSEDITRSILLQIILEEEAGGSPMFTAPVLESLIRFYGHAMQGFLGGYLENNIQNLIDVQARFAEQSKSFTPEMWSRFASLQTPVLQAMMGNTVEQNKALFAQIQEQMQKQTEQLMGAFGLKPAATPAERGSKG
ncbi:MAG: polyhydroxyalkanoate synthesis repressor PhaR [Rhodoferax sp.]